MFLTKWLLLSVLFFVKVAAAQTVVATEHQWTDDVVGSHIFQAGLDTWHINTSVNEDTTDNLNSLSRLQLANSYPVRDYRQTSPWMRFEGGLRLGRDVLLSMKYRTDQSTGSRLDEASVDWAFHTYGLKFGVLDPKISWCRTYDVDSPWVRENNPFCSIQPLNFAKGSAPGAQAYANFIVRDYSLQAVAGLYRPLWWDYASAETPTLDLGATGVVSTHAKSGLALSATNLRSGTELRLGLLRDSYQAHKDSSAVNVPYNYDVRSDVMFLGANWYATQKIALRATYFTYKGDLDRTYRSPTFNLLRQQQSAYKATSLELNYQLNAKDVFALAHVVYDYNLDFSNFDLQSGSTVFQSGYQGSPHFVTTNTSLSWRRDWGKGLFTVLQYSDASVSQTYSFSQKQLSSEGSALGLRLGYRF
jgi:hypothetical protein